MEKCRLYLGGIYIKQLQFPSDLLKWGTKPHAASVTPAQVLAPLPLLLFSLVTAAKGKVLGFISFLAF